MENGHPDTTESEYHEALYQLYELDSLEDHEASLSGAGETKCQMCDTEALVLS